MTTVVNDYPNKKARLEKIEKKVSFDLPVLTEKDKEQCGEVNQSETTRLNVQFILSCFQ